ncbi:claudin-4-like [Clavelina lepadiformis]|uniref:claudin-4-like n=1 Tax=Clavelina lepadiformis TaxID=159417 RepID=UPI00404149E9
MVFMKVSLGLTAACFVLAVSGLVLVCLCTYLPYWETSTSEKDSITRWAGLWRKCQMFQTANRDCDDFARFYLGIPETILLARKFTMASVICAVIAVASTVATLILGLINFKMKRLRLKILMLTGFIANTQVALGSGVCVLFAVTIFFYDMQQRNQEQLSNFSWERGPVYEPGRSLYYGWIGGGLLICGGILSLIAAVCIVIHLWRLRKERDNLGAMLHRPLVTSNVTTM